MSDDLKKTPLADTPVLQAYYQQRFDELQAWFLAAQSEDEAAQIALDLNPLANWLAARESRKK